MDTERSTPKQSFLRCLTALVGKIVSCEPRRSHPRFVVPGATITFGPGGSRRDLNNVMSDERLPVIELSRGGMSFLASQHHKINDKVVFSLILPESDNNIRLIGRIAYCVPLGIGHDYRFRVGMEFAESGVGKGYNTLGALEVLKSLEESCQNLETMDV